MNYSIVKDSTDLRYNHIFLEKVYSDYIDDQPPKDFYSAAYSYYNLAELQENIKKSFGEPLDTITYQHFLAREKCFVLSEQALVYETFVVFLKTKVSTYGVSEYPLTRYERLEEEEEEKEDGNKIRLDVYSNGIDKTIGAKLSTFISHVVDLKRKKSELSILCYNQMEGFHLKNIKTLKGDLNIEENYNDDFAEISEYIIDKLNKDDSKGIVLLHGLPGTGKTSYIRHLTKEIKEKNIIYVPPDFASNISNPEFVEFFLEHENSILIIEDAENILKSRKAGGNQAVSNLLSLSDGLLGDGLKLQILCTFNSALSEVDEALLREGRLIAEYKFDKLAIDKAQALLNKVYKEDTAPKVDKEMTLAEIFNHRDKRYITKKNNSGIGFNR